MSKLIFGCGYLGRRVAERWRAVDDQVYVVTRSDKHAQAFAQQGYRPIVANVLAPQTLANLPPADAVLYAVGYDRAAGASMHAVYVDGLRAALAALPEETGKFIYISSTGVYGQTDGEWVDEDSPCQPMRKGGKACLAAENVLQTHPLGERAIVLRMAGLYGPGRVPNVNEIRNQQPIAAPENGFLNLIHRDDAASVVLAAAELAKPPRTYLVADGHPVERRAYYQELAGILRAGPPRFVAPAENAPSALRAAADKRIRNARMLTELHVELAYPSYRQGLASIVAADTQD